MYTRYERRGLVGTGTEAELLVKLLTSWTVPLQGSLDSFGSVRELGRRIKVRPKKGALCFCCEGSGVLLGTKGAFRVSINYYDTAWSGHFELEVGVVWHCVESSKRSSFEQCMIAAAEWDDIKTISSLSKLSGDPKITSSVIEPVQRAFTSGMTPLKVVFVGLILDGLMPIFRTVS